MLQKFTITMFPNNIWSLFMKIYLRECRQTDKAAGGLVLVRYSLYVMYSVIFRV